MNEPSTSEHAGAVIASSSILAGPLAGATLLGWLLKATNPSHVDVAADMAYLRPILIVGWALVLIAVISAIALNVRASRAGRGRVAWAVFTLQLVFMVAYGIATAASESLT